MSNSLLLRILIDLFKEINFSTPIGIVDVDNFLITMNTSLQYVILFLANSGSTPPMPYTIHLSKYEL